MVLSKFLQSLKTSSIGSSFSYREYSFILKISLLLLFIAAISNQVIGQDKGKVRVFTRPSDAIIKLDSIKLEYGKFIELDTGTYKVKAWTEKRKLVERVLKLDSGYSKTLRIDLPYTDNYKVYRYNTAYYKVKKNLLRYAPIVGSIYFLSKTYSDIQSYKIDAKNFKEQALLYQTAYENAFWEPSISFHKNRFEQYKRNYTDAVDNLNQANNLLIISSVTAAATIYFGWKLSNKLKRPTFEEEPKLSDLKLGPMVSPYLNGITFSCKFN